MPLGHSHWGNCWVVWPCLALYGGGACAWVVMGWTVEGRRDVVVVVEAESCGEAGGMAG